MKPYYQEDGITIYHGDCRKILPTLPAVDLVLTDPPYGIGVDYESFNDTQAELKKLIADVIDIVITKASRAFITTGVLNIHLYPKPTWVFCWATPAGTGKGPWGFCCWQPILVYGKDPYLQHGMGSRADIFLITETSEKNGHPCPKPRGLWKKLLVRGSIHESDTVLDPFMGSGTTLVAAKHLGRKAIGIDIERKYCDIAIDRLRQEVLPFEPQPVVITDQASLLEFMNE